MKTKLFILTILFSCYSFGQISDANLVAHYDFESNGNNQISNNFNLSPFHFNGLPSYTDDGILGSCVNFNGNNTLANYGQLATYFAEQEDKSISISFWVKSNSIPDNIKTFVEGFESIVVRGFSAYFYISRSNGDYQFSTSNFLVNDNLWHHLVYVYDAGSNNLKGYVDNNLLVNLNLTGDEAEIYQYTNRFVVGCGTNLNGAETGTFNWSQKGYTGKIDEMYLFSRAISESEVESLFDLETPQSDCPESDLILNSQEDVEAFIAQYPNCTEILGNLNISGESITDISGLENITSIDGTLIISETSLENLVGLENITNVYDITISDNLQLTTIESLGSGGTVINSLSITSNPILENLDGVTNFTNTDYCDVLLIDLPLVDSLEPFSNFSGNASFYIQGLSITNLSGLEEITNSSYLSLMDLPFLSSMDGLQLTSINSLPVPRNDNNLPNDINGFQTGLVIISTSIESLFPLNSLESLGNNPIILNNNPNLFNISGLSNVDPDSVSQLVILNNQNLKNCAISVICEIIANLNDENVQIENNSNNCISVETVQGICETLSNDSFNNINVKLYPIPFKNQINIALGNQVESSTVDLYDISGKRLLTQKSTNNIIEINDLESLQNGIYFLKIQLANGSFKTLKAVK